MVAFRGTYQADLERDFYLVSLFTRFRVAEDAEFVPSEDPYLPPSFVNAVTLGSGPCRMPVTPRRALLFISERIQLEVPIPFRGGTAEYIQMRSEIEANSQVLAYEILPEEIAPDKLLLFLR